MWVPARRRKFSKKTGLPNPDFQEIMEMRSCHVWVVERGSLKTVRKIPLRHYGPEIYDLCIPSSRSELRDSSDNSYMRIIAVEDQSLELQDTLQEQAGGIQQQELMIQEQASRIQEQASRIQEQASRIQEQAGRIQQQELMIQEQAGRVQQQESMIQEQAGRVQQQELMIQEQAGRVQQQELMIQEQESTIHRMISSRSWRLTAPLRYVARAIGLALT